MLDINLHVFSSDQQRIGLQLSQIGLDICSCLHTCDKVTRDSLLKVAAHCNITIAWMLIPVLSLSLCCVLGFPVNIKGSYVTRSFSQYDILNINSMVKIVTHHALTLAHMKPLFYDVLS